MTQSGTSRRGRAAGQGDQAAQRLARERRLLADIADAVEQVADSVEELRQAMLSLVATVQAAGRPLRRADLLALRGPVGELLRRHEGFAAGAGVVLAPAVLQDAPLWIDWCWADRGSGFEQLEADLDPDSPEFYDYTTTEWYREPERTGGRCIAGPYVDYICTHEYTFTLSTPLVHEGQFIGVAGADILAEQVERLVLPGLARLGCVAVLASGNGRVIASNAPQLTPGVVLGRDEASSGLLAVAGPSDATRRSPLPWVLLEGDSLDPAAGR
jgi:hypothetical protein